MTFNSTAASLTKHGRARRIDTVECFDLLQQAYDHKLVQFGENVCPMEAMVLVSANDPHHPNRKKVLLNEERYLGCGVCVRSCLTKSIMLKSRTKRVLTPLNGLHKTVMMAIERGTLQHLIFDNRVLFSHRALAAVLGILLRLLPIKQVMASLQIKSRFFERASRRF